LDDIYKKFLFIRFLKAYNTTFAYSKNNGPLHSRYTWYDTSYRGFMIDILKNLEPRREKKGVKLFQELAEFDEVIFFMQGVYDIGYTLNMQEKYKLRFRHQNVIGAYGATFNKRALFIYRTATDCNGYFIRKSNWLNIINNTDNIDLCLMIKQHLKNDYEGKIKAIMLNFKHREILKLVKRADYDNIMQLSVINKPVLNEIDQSTLQGQSPEQIVGKIENDMSKLGLGLDPETLQNQGDFINSDQLKDVSEILEVDEAIMENDEKIKNCQSVLASHYETIEAREEYHEERYCQLEQKYNLLL